MVLIDTATFIFLCKGSHLLTLKAKQLIAKSNTVWLPEVSIWEMVGLSRKGKAVPTADQLREFVEENLASYGIGVLPFDRNIVWQCVHLPWHHSAPFDRYLVQTAITQGVPFLSPDAPLRVYRPAGLQLVW